MQRYVLINENNRSPANFGGGRFEKLACQQSSAYRGNTEVPCVSPTMDMMLLANRLCRLMTYYQKVSRLRLERPWNGYGDSHIRYLRKVKRRCLIKRLWAKRMGDSMVQTHLATQGQ